MTIDDKIQYYKKVYTKIFLYDSQNECNLFNLTLKRTLNVFLT